MSWWFFLNFDHSIFENQMISWCQILTLRLWSPSYHWKELGILKCTHQGQKMYPSRCKSKGGSSSDATSWTTLFYAIKEFSGIPLKTRRALFCRLPQLNCISSITIGEAKVFSGNPSSNYTSTKLFRISRKPPQKASEKEASNFFSGFLLHRISAKLDFNHAVFLWVCCRSWFIGTLAVYQLFRTSLGPK